MYTKDEYLELIPDLWWTTHTREAGASPMAVYVEQYVAEIADDSVVPECNCWLRNNPEQMKRQFLDLLSIDEKYNYLSLLSSKTNPLDLDQDYTKLLQENLFLIAKYQCWV